MTNVIAATTARIERRMTETKTPCKFYQTQAAADKAAAKMAVKGANYFAINANGQAAPARYVTFEVKNLGWVAAFDLTELMSRKTMSGGYIGIFAVAGFFCY